MDYHDENFVPKDRKYKSREYHSNKLINPYSNSLNQRPKSQGIPNSILHSRNHPSTSTFNNETNFNELLIEKDRKIKGLEKEIEKTKNSHYHLSNDDIRGKYGYISRYPEKKTQSSVKFNIGNVSPEKQYSQDDRYKEQEPINISPNGKSRTESTRTVSSSKTSTNSAQIQINDIFFRMVIIPFLQKVIKQFLSSLVFKKSAQELNERFNEMLQCEYEDYKKLDLLNDILKNLSYLNMQHIALVNKDIQYERASEEVAHLYGNANNEDTNSLLQRNKNNNYDTTILGLSGNMLNQPFSTSDSVEYASYADVYPSLSPSQMVQLPRKTPGPYNSRYDYQYKHQLGVNYPNNGDSRNSQGPTKENIRIPTRGSIINPALLSDRNIPNNIRPLTGRHIKYSSKIHGVINPSKKFLNNTDLKYNGHPLNFEFHDSYKENI